LLLLLPHPPNHQVLGFEDFRPSPSDNCNELRVAGCSLVFC